MKHNLINILLLVVVCLTTMSFKCSSATNDVPDSAQTELSAVLPDISAESVIDLLGQPASISAENTNGIVTYKYHYDSVSFSGPLADLIQSSSFRNVNIFIRSGKVTDIEINLKRPENSTNKYASLPTATKQIKNLYLK